MSFDIGQDVRVRVNGLVGKVVRIENYDSMKIYRIIVGDQVFDFGEAELEKVNSAKEFISVNYDIKNIEHEHQYITPVEWTTNDGYAEVTKLRCFCGDEVGR